MLFVNTVLHFNTEPRNGNDFRLESKRSTAQLKHQKMNQKKKSGNKNEVIAQKTCNDCKFGTIPRGLPNKQSEDRVWCLKHERNNKYWHLCSDFTSELIRKPAPPAPPAILSEVSDLFARQQGDDRLSNVDRLKIVEHEIRLDNDEYDELLLDERIELVRDRLQAYLRDREQWLKRDWWDLLQSIRWE